MGLAELYLFILEPHRRQTSNAIYFLTDIQITEKKNKNLQNEHHDTQLMKKRNNKCKKEIQI